MHGHYKIIYRIPKTVETVLEEEDEEEDYLLGQRGETGYDSNMASNTTGQTHVNTPLGDVSDKHM